MTVLPPSRRRKAVRRRPCRRISLLHLVTSITVVMVAVVVAVCGVRGPELLVLEVVVADPWPKAIVLLLMLVCVAAWWLMPVVSWLVRCVTTIIITITITDGRLLEATPRPLQSRAASRGCRGSRIRLLFCASGALPACLPYRAVSPVVAACSFHLVHVRAASAQPCPAVRCRP